MDSVLPWVLSIILSHLPLQPALASGSRTCHMVTYTACGWGYLRWIALYTFGFIQAICSVCWLQRVLLFFWEMGVTSCLMISLQRLWHSYHSMFFPYADILLVGAITLCGFSSVWGFTQLDCLAVHKTSIMSPCLSSTAMMSILVSSVARDSGNHWRPPCLLLSTMPRGSFYICLAISRVSIVFLSPL